MSSDLLIASPVLAQRRVSPSAQRPLLYLVKHRFYEHRPLQTASCPLLYSISQPVAARHTGSRPAPFAKLAAKRSVRLGRAHMLRRSTRRSLHPPKAHNVRSASLRNIAIIAHVDHGKTTLVDQLFRQSGTFRDNQRVEERAMDSNDLEKERGITILAKCTSIEWETATAHQHRRHARPRRLRRRGRAHPRHGRRRDPAGRQLRRRDAADQVRHRQGAGAGPQADRRASTRSTARTSASSEVLDEVFDLFVSLGANDEQLDFPVLYASGRNG